jgi:ethanolamine utilization protein EutN
MSGRKLLLLRPQLVDDKDPTKFRNPGVNTIVAVDSVGPAGRDGDVLPGQQRPPGPGMKEAPVDAVIIGIVDTVDVLGQIYSARTRVRTPGPNRQVNRKKTGDDESDQK